MKNVFTRGLAVATLGLTLSAGLVSCNDLDLTPKYENTPDKVYVDLNGYRSVLAKVYGGLSVTGLGTDGANGNASGDGDIGGVDEGTSDYIRQFWSAQELTTDEAVVAWLTDPGIADWHNMNWTSSNILVRGLYYRLYYQIAICNEFIRESSDDKLNARLSGADIATAKRYRAEARFLRAVAYQHVVDLYGGGPFVVDTDPTAYTPPYRTRQQLFEFVEQELQALATSPDMAEPRTNEYGRVDKAAAWAMLSRLYLNAHVYTAAVAGQNNGTNRFTDAARYAKMVVDQSGYTLNTSPAAGVASSYGRLFLADNHLAPARNEIIWAVAFDYQNTRSFGGVNFLINASTNSNTAGWRTYAGIPGGWNGIRATRNLVNVFGADTARGRDTRGRFWAQGQTLDIDDLSQFTQGYGVLKFRNVTSTGSTNPQPLAPAFYYSNTDFPMIRLAEVMLNYAEAVQRGGTGDASLALSYVNQIRRRAYNQPINTLNAAVDFPSLTPERLLDERQRELHWEGFRRTDLIRFDNLFTRVTGDARSNWPWKGGASTGRGVEDTRVLFPIPASDRAVNPNLPQNPGY